MKRFSTCRPITITFPMYKILEYVLNKRLNNFLNENSNFKLDNQQTGFRRKVGTEVNILRIITATRETIKECKGSIGKTFWTMFFDFKSAFDLVDHS